MYASSEKARKLSEGDGLTIGYSDPTELGGLVAALSTLRVDARQPGISLRQGPRDANVELLSHGRLDLALGFESSALESGGIMFSLLREDRLVCIVRRDSPLASLDAMGAAQVEGLPQVVCLPAGLQRRGYAAQGAIPVGQGVRATYCQTASEALCLVDAGFGFALLPSVQAADSPTHICIGWEGAPHARYGVYRRMGESNPLVDMFLEAAAQSYR